MSLKVEDVMRASVVIIDGEYSARQAAEDDGGVRRVVAGVGGV